MKRAFIACILVQCSLLFAVSNTGAQEEISGYGTGVAQKRSNDQQVEQSISKLKEISKKLFSGFVLFDDISSCDSSSSKIDEKFISPLIIKLSDITTIPNYSGNLRLGYNRNEEIVHLEKDRDGTIVIFLSERAMRFGDIMTGPLNLDSEQIYDPVSSLLALIGSNELLQKIRDMGFEMKSGLVSFVGVDHPSAVTPHTQAFSEREQVTTILRRMARDFGGSYLFKICSESRTIYVKNDF